MKRLLIFILAITTIENDLFAAEAGMPQLDPKYWASQGFWLILIFVILYFSIAKFFIPKIKNNLDNRENKIKDEQLEKNRIQIMKFKKSYTVKLMLNNPLTSLKIITWKALQTGILNPAYIFHYHYYEQDIQKKPPWYLEKSYINFWMPINIFYSLVIYLVVILGFVSSIKYLDLKYNLFLFFSAIYMFVMLSWVGNSRYFSPSLISLSVYFGCGINFLINQSFYKKNVN